MLLLTTSVLVADNTDGHLGVCIGILGGSRLARAGDQIIITVKKVLYNRKIIAKRKKKVIKGYVYKVIVLRTSYWRRRKENFFFRTAGNAVAVLGNWGMPMGSRAKGPGHFELKISQFPKFSSICQGAV